MKIRIIRISMISLVLLIINLIKMQFIKGIEAAIIYDFMYTWLNGFTGQFMLNVLFVMQSWVVNGISSYLLCNKIDLFDLRYESRKEFINNNLFNFIIYNLIFTFITVIISIFIHGISILSLQSVLLFLVYNLSHALMIVALYLMIHQYVYSLLGITIMQILVNILQLNGGLQLLDNLFIYVAICLLIAIFGIYLIKNEFIKVDLIGR